MPDNPAEGPRYQWATVRLADLVVTSDEIADATFEDCVIVGPAVVMGFGTAMTECVWPADPLTVIWPLTPNRPAVLGAIPLVRCRFIRCRFERVGLALDEADAAQLRDDFRRGSESQSESATD